MGDYFGYRHNRGMEKYCGQAIFAKSSLIIITVLLGIFKLLTVFMKDGYQWSAPSFFTFLTLANVVYYGIVGICANAAAVFMDE